MARSKRTIRASEIGSFFYCQRAWWYQRKKIPTINTAELAGGQDFHRLHVHQTRAAHVAQNDLPRLLICAVVSDCGCLLIQSNSVNHIVQIYSPIFSRLLRIASACSAFVCSHSRVFLHRSTGIPIGRIIYSDHGAGKKPANRSMMRTSD